MVELLDLSTEILEQIFLHQEDMEDMISLGSSCSRLHQVLSKPNIWADLLTKAKIVTMIETKQDDKFVVKKIYKLNLQVARMLISFLTTVDAPKVLLGLLHDSVLLLHAGVLLLHAGLPGSSEVLPPARPPHRLYHGPPDNGLVGDRPHHSFCTSG